jgi:transposase
MAPSSLETETIGAPLPDQDALLQMLYRWRDQATKAGHNINRMVVAFEAGRDGFWLARWLRARDIEAYVIHPTSIPVSREQRRAKTDRLDVGLLKRALLGWLRGEAKHLGAAAPKCFSAEQIIMRSGIAGTTKTR